jgi:hypothetical protein
MNMPTWSLHSLMETPAYEMGKMVIGPSDLAEEALEGITWEIASNPLGRSEAIVQAPDLQIATQVIRIGRRHLRVAIFYRVIEPMLAELTSLCISELPSQHLAMTRLSLVAAPSFQPRSQVDRAA